VPYQLAAMLMALGDLEDHFSAFETVLTATPEEM